MENYFYSKRFDYRGTDVPCVFTFDPRQNWYGFSLANNSISNEATALTPMNLTTSPCCAAHGDDANVPPLHRQTG